MQRLKAMGMGIRECDVEGDCKMVIGWGKGIGNGLWQLSVFIHEIRELSRLLGVSLVHIPREQNVLADKLANSGVGLSLVFIGDSNPNGL